MADVGLEVRDWSEGVICALEGDEIPNNALSRGWNTAFRSVGKNKAVIGTRPGLVTINDVALTGTPQVFRMVPYDFNDNGDFQHYGAICQNNGKLNFLLADVMGSELVPPTDFPFAAGSAFTSGDHLVDGAVMNNQLFLVNSNGERRSLHGTTYEPFGLSPISSVAVTNVVGGSSSMPATSYDIWVTSYDDDIGEESSAIATTTVTLGANERIRVTITPSAAEIAQYPFWRVYVRRNDTQAVGYRVLALEDVGGSAVTATGDIPIGTTVVYVDLTAAQIANLILQAPGLTENNQPSTTVKFVEAYGGRLILADGRNIYWSKLNLPRAFPPENFEPIDSGTGEEVKGIHRFSDELLLIFTTGGVFGLFGNDPQTWTLRPIDLTVGLSSHMSVVDFAGNVAWWSAQHGPVAFDGQSIVQIGDELLGHDRVVEEVEASRLGYIGAGWQPENDRIVFAYTTLNGTRNDKQIPYNYRLNRWESDKWDGMDAASLGTLSDNDGQQRLYVGGYEGQLFRYSDAVKNDGIVDGTTEFTWTPAASSTTVIPGTGFYNTNGKLVERKVTITDEGHRPVYRGYVTGNTDTTVTVAIAVAGLAVGESYNVYLGGPDVRMQSKWFDFDLPFMQKRIDRLYLHARSETEDTSLKLATQVDFIDETQPSVELVDLEGAFWDSGIWDSNVWAGSGTFKKRISVIRHATAFRFVLLHPDVDKDVVLLKVSAVARVLTDRYFE